MLPEWSTTASMATPSVETSESTVPLRGRARARISRARHSSRATTSTGRSRSRQETGQLPHVHQAGELHRRAALRAQHEASPANGKHKQQQQRPRRIPLHLRHLRRRPSASRLSHLSVTSTLRSSDLVFSMKSFTRSNVRWICSVVGSCLANLTRSQCVRNSPSTSLSDGGKHLGRTAAPPGTPPSCAPGRAGRTDPRCSASGCR